MSGPNLGLGIDTGGTYTDAAILNMDDGRVLCKAKALTTRNDLSQGIANAIEKLDRSMFENIRLVTISSTLATNSVVEGKGCRVGLIVIGHEAVPNIPVDEVVQISGGHDMQGDPAARIDIDAARAFIENVKDRVDAFAISGFFSVQEPRAREEVKEMVRSMTNAPVVCGHELSSALGFNERTITAVLNARLIPIIADLIASLKLVQKSTNINAPLMIVKGDGSLMDESVARERPVETILSGPAASMIGAKALTGLQDAIMIDVGGTTTDIGILRGGVPACTRGRHFGGWRTRVKAVDVFTAGIGGDSRIVVTCGKAHLTPLRVIPLCIASSYVSFIKIEITGTPWTKRKMGPSQPDRGVNPSVHRVLCLLQEQSSGEEVMPNQEKILELVRSEPRSLYELAELLNVHLMSLDLKGWRRSE